MSDLSTDPAVFLGHLETHTLNSVFERYGNFAEPREDKTTHFHGNFADLSARFDFVLAGEAAQRVELAIRRHQRTGRYLAERVAERKRRVRTWARQQRSRRKFAGPDELSGPGSRALRLVEQDKLEEAEKLMAKETE